MTTKTTSTARINGETAITQRKLRMAVMKRGDAPFIKEVKERALAAFWEVLNTSQDMAMQALMLGLPGTDGYMIPFKYRHDGFSKWEYAREGHTQFEFFDDIGSDGTKLSWDIRLWRDEIAPSIIAAKLVPKGWTDVFLPAALEAIANRQAEKERYANTPRDEGEEEHGTFVLQMN